MSSEREGRYLALHAPPLYAKRIIKERCIIMAFKNEKKNEQKFEYALNEVANVKQWEDGAITFSAMVNGIWIYNLRIVERRMFGSSRSLLARAPTESTGNTSIFPSTRTSRNWSRLLSIRPSKNNAAIAPGAYNSR